jgi:hypothetical protein
MNAVARSSPTRSAGWIRSGDAAFVLLLLLTTRALLTVIGVISRLLLQPLRTEPYPWSYSKSLWLSIWGVWDSGWYLDVAKFGYSSALRHDPEILNQANYAFFPLYPLAMRVLGPFVGGPFNAGILVSNISLFGTCLVLLRLVRLDHDDLTARRAVKYLVLFPTGFILSGVFSESLFLALAVSSFYLLRKERLLAAGAVGFLASLTRSVGVLLILPLAIEYWRQRRSQSRPIEARAAFLFLAPMGLVVFAAYNYALTGNALAFARVQSSWGRTFHSPVAVLVGGLSDPDISSRFAAWLTLVAVVSLIVFAKRVGVPYLVLSLCFIAVPLATGLNSMPRFLLAVFPLPLLMATVSKNPSFDDALTATHALLQGALMVFWVNGFKLVV